VRWPNKLESVLPSYVQKFFEMKSSTVPYCCISTLLWQVDKVINGCNE
jgi:hypothetical protein